jgi:16S rRNA (cytidine1402-2'-O)-methyltransferase
MAGKLILLPNLLDSEADTKLFFPEILPSIIQSIQGLICESEKEGRRYLRRFLSHEEMNKIPLSLLNEHTKELDSLLNPLIQGKTLGLISDAGLCCIADPGADLVFQANKHQILVQSIPGPSSIFLALQLSGLPSQRFSFHGYLPKDDVVSTLKILEKKSKQEHSTQLFIEAPYRSQKLLDTLIQTLSPSTILCVASSLTSHKEKVKVAKISQWRSINLALDKEPTLFLFYS